MITKRLSEFTSLVSKSKIIISFLRTGIELQIPVPKVLNIFPLEFLTV